MPETGRLRAQGRCMPYVAKIREKSIKKTKLVVD